MYHVRNKMDAVGLDMLLDIHGDEELPYNFINGNEVSHHHLAPPGLVSIGTPACNFGCTCVLLAAQLVMMCIRYGHMQIHMLVKFHCTMAKPVVCPVRIGYVRACETWLCPHVNMTGLEMPWAPKVHACGCRASHVGGRGWPSFKRPLLSHSRSPARTSKASMAMP